jgi:hypothetical protein
MSASLLQALNASSLVNFAQDVVNHAWYSNCTASHSPMLRVSFAQFISDSKHLMQMQNQNQPFWHFGNNPVTTMYCCYSAWLYQTSAVGNNEQYVKCPRTPTSRTLHCALNNTDRIELVLIAEKMPLSMQLLEIFLNWTIPKTLKALQINEAIYVTPTAPKIEPGDLILAERYVQLDRVIYQTALAKFWTAVHSANILPVAAGKISTL